jgi:hypothetical protein
VTDDDREAQTPSSRPTPAVSAFAEETAAALAAAGFPRMPARVLMALTVTETARLTSEELASTLSASPAAISGAVRYLETVGMLHRHSIPGSRRHLYGLPEHAWYAASSGRDGLYLHLEALSERGSAALPPGSAAAARVDEMRDFYRFMRERMPSLLEEWRAGR